jgi:hypothetical protein
MDCRNLIFASLVVFICCPALRGDEASGKPMKSVSGTNY